MGALLSCCGGDDSDAGVGQRADGTVIPPYKAQTAAVPDPGKEEKREKMLSAAEGRLKQNEMRGTPNAGQRRKPVQYAQNNDPGGVDIKDWVN